MRFFYKQQYGFLKGKTTTDAILRFSDEVYESFNNKKSLISVFLGFSKTFDMVDHSILLKNLSIVGSVVKCLNGVNHIYLIIANMLVI